MKFPLEDAYPPIWGRSHCNHQKAQRDHDYSSLQSLIVRKYCKNTLIGVATGYRTKRKYIESLLPINSEFSTITIVRLSGNTLNRNEVADVLYRMINDDGYDITTRIYPRRKKTYKLYTYHKHHKD